MPGALSRTLSRFDTRAFKKLAPQLSAPRCKFSVINFRSPLTLSHDMTNATIMDAIWPIITNTVCHAARDWTTSLSLSIVSA